MIMNINSKYSNEEILKSITNENLKRWAEFLDSKGAILLQVKETKGLYTSKQIKILSTKHNIITIDFDGGLYYKSKFVKIVEKIRKIFIESTAKKVYNRDSM